MAPKLADYIEAGYALTPGERLEAARMLRLSVDQDVDSDSTEAAAAWLGEIGGRVDDIAAGRVALVDAEETYRMISSELQSRE
ncbi:addiction module protein [Agrococcus sp. KRD186]|uniref:addiction module protein n=1 Tax=Agrococcus sp. KRD186 TaxID=2729730 RepID=UPI0019D2BC9D|nr:addiction module protein [Agrococcus sp. KRD186]